MRPGINPKPAAIGGPAASTVVEYVANWIAVLFKA